MKIREPRQGHVAFLWVWGLFFGGIPLVMLVSTFSGQLGGIRSGPPVAFLLLFPAISTLVLGAATRRSMRAGFELIDDGILGAHDAELDVIAWDEIDHIAWRWSPETSGVEVNGRPLPDGFALHAIMRDGREVRLMQRVAAKYGQQQRINEQMDRAGQLGVLPIPFDATMPSRDVGAWGPAEAGAKHTTWSSDDLPPSSTGPSSHDDDEPVWPTS